MADPSTKRTRGAPLEEQLSTDLPIPVSSAQRTPAAMGLGTPQASIQIARRQRLRESRLARLSQGARTGRALVTVAASKRRQWWQFLPPIGGVVLAFRWSESRLARERFRDDLTRLEWLRPRLARDQVEGMH